MCITSIFYLLLKASLRQTIVEVEMPLFGEEFLWILRFHLERKIFFFNIARKNMHKYLIT